MERSKEWDKSKFVSERKTDWNTTKFKAMCVKWDGNPDKMYWKFVVAVNEL
jgi:hypothetical protein